MAVYIALSINPQGGVVNSTRMENMGTAPNKPLTELQQKMSICDRYGFSTT